MTIELPDEVAATAVAIGGTLLVAGASLSVIALAAWMGAGLTTDGYLLVIPLLPVLISIGPGILAGVMLCLPRRQGLWRPGLWVVSVLGGWSLLAIIWSADLPWPHSSLGSVLAPLLFALIGLALIYAAAMAALTPRAP